LLVYISAQVVSLVGELQRYSEWITPETSRYMYT
jgi:hypothetical protein